MTANENHKRRNIFEVLTHGEQISLNSDCPMDPMDPSDKRVYYRTNNYPMDIKTSYFKNELKIVLCKRSYKVNPHLSILTFISVAIKLYSITDVYKNIGRYKC